MEKNSVFFAITMFAHIVAFSQGGQAISSGTVDYEKSINNYALVRQMIGTSPDALQQQKFEQYQKTHPQFTVLKSTLTFGGKKSIFVPEQPAVSVFPLFSIPTADQNNAVFNDFSNYTSVTQKRVFDKVFLISDTLGKIRWKITDETREINGYTCRRANAIILDSLYVVAFYSDEIHVPSGPEIFCGLPGLILEVALPHEHIIWRATKVSFSRVEAETIEPPTRGEKLNSARFDRLLSTFLENRDDPMGLTRKSLQL